MAERDAGFGDITVQHLLTMSSGLSFDDGSSPWADPANTYHGAAITEPRVEGPPGVVFDYNDWNVILLGLVLERAAGMPVAEFMETRLWQPMGAEAEESWSLDRDNGDHGQFIYVDPAAELVIVRHGWSPRAVDWVQLMGDLADWLAPKLRAA